MAAGAVEGDDILVTGRTVVGSVGRCCMVHRRSAVEIRPDGLPGVAGGTVERRLVNSGMAAGTLVVHRRRREMVHRRAAVLGGTLRRMTVGAVEGGRIDVGNALVALTTIIGRVCRRRMMQLRYRGCRQYRGMTAFTG